MPFFALPQDAVGPALTISLRRFANATAVRGYDGNPASGRTIIAVGRDVFAAEAVVGQTRTDSSGNYSMTLFAGDNDLFLLVAVGDILHNEYSRVLGSMKGVPA